MQTVELRGNASGSVRLVVRPFDPSTLPPEECGEGICSEAKRAAAFWPELPAVFAPDTLVASVIGGTVAHLDRAVQVTRGDTVHARLELSEATGGFRTFVFEVADPTIVRVGRLGIDTTASASDTIIVRPGQLSADVVLYGRGTGTTMVRPHEIVVDGSAATGGWSAATVTSLDLTIYSESRAHPGLMVIGAGQYDSTSAQVVPSRLSVPITVNMTTENLAVAATDPVLAVDGRGTNAFFRLAGIAPGSTRLFATAAGWDGDTVGIRVTTPRLRGGTACCEGGALTTLSAPQDVVVLVTDSLGVPHARATDLAVTVTSSNPAVLEVEGGTATIRAGQQAGGGARLLPRGAGTATIRFSAEGHPDDVMEFTVSAMALSLSSTPFESDGLDSVFTAVGMFSDSALYVRTSMPVPRVVPIALVAETPGIVSLADTVYLPSGSQVVKVGRIAGVGTGTTRVFMRAEGFGEAVAVVTVTRPRVQLFVQPTLQLVGETTNFLFGVTDSTGIQTLYPSAPIEVSLTARNTAVVQSTGTTISYDPTDPENSFEAPVRPVGVGSTYIVASAPGFILDSVPVTVVAPALVGLNDGEPMVVSVGLATIGVPFTRALADTVAVDVNLVRDGSSVGSVSVPGTVRIDRNQASTNVDVIGVTRGRTVLRLEESGSARYASGATNIIDVTPTQLRLTTSSVGTIFDPPSRMALEQSLDAYVAAMDSASSAQNRLGVFGEQVAARGAVIRISSSDPSVLLVEAPDDGSGTSPSSSVEVFIGGEAPPISSRIRIHPVGVGTATLTVQDVSDIATPERWVSTSVSITIDAPRVTFRTGGRLGRAGFSSLGMRQRFGAFASGDTLQVCRMNVAGSGYARGDRDVYVRLRTSNASIARGLDPLGDAIDDDEVVIPANQECASIDVVARDTTGTVAISIDAFDSGESGFLGDTLRIEVGQPGVAIFEVDRFASGRLRTPGTLGPISVIDSTRIVRVVAVDHRGQVRMPADTVPLQLVWSDSSRLVGSDTIVRLRPGNEARFFLYPRAAGVSRLTVRDARGVPGDPAGASPVAHRVAYRSAEAAFVVATPAITISPNVTSALGVGQSRRVHVSIPSTGGNRVRIAVTSTNPSILRPSNDTISIDGGEGGSNTENEVDVEGLVEGTAELVFTSPGHAPARVAFRVSKGSLVLEGLREEYATSTSGRHFFRLRLTDSTGVPSDTVDDVDPRTTDEERFYVTYGAGTITSDVLEVQVTDSGGGSLPSDARGPYVRVHSGAGLADLFVRAKANGTERITFTSASGNYRVVKSQAVRIVIPPPP